MNTSCFTRLWDAMRSPPIGINFGNFWPNLKITLKTLGINYLLIALLVLIIFLLFGHEKLIYFLDEYIRSLYGWIFWPLETIDPASIYNFCLYGPAAEEVLFRGPIFILLKNNFWLRPGGYSLTKYFLIAGSLLLNSYWASEHLFALPIFITGLPLYWLLIKTKSLWPCIAYHSLANLTLFILAQTAVYLKII